MGLLPSIPGLDLAKTIGDFFTLLNRIDSKLAKLLEIEKARDDRERSLRGGNGAANRALGIYDATDWPLQLEHPDQPSTTSILDGLPRKGGD